MVNESILGGLRVAVSHKSSLKEAMQSFYNAGYDKAEIEEAAKIVFEEQQNINQKKDVAEKTKEKSTTQIGQPPNKKSAKKIVLIIALIALVIILVGGLSALFIFKDKIF